MLISALLLGVVFSEQIQVTLQPTKSSFEVVPSNYVGFSMAWGTLDMDGVTKAFLEDEQNLVLDKAVVQALTNLRKASGNHQSAIIRIGGNISMDPDFQVSDKALKTLRLLADQARVKFIIGCAVSLEPNFIVEFLKRVVTIVGRANIVALSVGNEPDHLVKQGRRTEPYTYDSYRKELQVTLDAIKSQTNFRVFQGPSFAGCNTFLEKDCWEKNWPAFAKEFPDHKYIGFHRYGASGCSKKTTVNTLLEDPLPTGNRSFEYIEALRKILPKSKKIVWGEGNSLSCGGGIQGISNTFPAALWAVDSLLEASVAGVSRVHFHGIPTTTYAPFFKLKNGGIKIMPLYYAMLFVQRMIGGNQSTTFKPTYQSINAKIKIWGVDDKKNNEKRIIVVNKDIDGNAAITVAIDAKGFKTARKFVLKGKIDSGDGITLNGLSFDGTTNGILKNSTGQAAKLEGEPIEIVNGKVILEVGALNVMAISLS